MDRRQFLSKGAKAAAGMTLVSGSLLGRRLQQEPDFHSIAEARGSHPLYFDGLTFFGEREGDLPKSGLSGLVWDVSSGVMEGNKYIRKMVPSLKSIADANRFLRTNKDGMFLATKGSAVPEARRTGRTAVFLQFQSLEPVTEDLKIMDVFYELGLRIMQFTHHYGNAFAGGCLVKEWTGLTDLGRKALEKMNGLGIIPDLSHGNEVMARDILEASKKPVIISHTGCRALVNNARCAPDSVIKGVADSGGVVGIFSMSFWLTEDPVPTIEHYVKQLEHVINIGGEDAVGISNDYDISGHSGAAAVNNDNSEAVKGYFPWWKQHEGVLGFDKLPEHVVIPEINNIRRFFVIQDALEKRGYSARRIEKIMGGNWVRVLTDCLG